MLGWEWILWGRLNCILELECIIGSVLHCNTVTALNILKTTGLSAKHFLRQLVNHFTQSLPPPTPNPNPSTFSLSIVHGPSSSHLAFQQELCREKLIFQVGKFVCGRGGGDSHAISRQSNCWQLPHFAICWQSTVYLLTVYIYTSPWNIAAHSSCVWQQHKPQSSSLANCRFCRDFDLSVGIMILDDVGL